MDKAQYLQSVGPIEDIERNWYVFKNRIPRVNSEVICADYSLVGYLSYPTVVGATCTVFILNPKLLLIKLYKIQLVVNRGGRSLDY